ncbi:hypothetical protein BG004_005395 [Podila humilis]|nr:hypothetical protein BG004_005395 [Podila humilis]
MGILPTSQFPLLVVLNPHSGKKQSQHAFDTIVAPALTSINREYTLFISTGQGQVQEYFQTKIQPILIDLIQSLPAGNSDAINKVEAIAASSATLQVMVLGGDGTVHEIVNGVMRGVEGTLFASDQFRPRVEISVIPTGTGNSISTSLGVASIQDAVDRFLAGKTASLQVMTVSTRDNKNKSNSNSDSDSDISVSTSKDGLSGWKPQVYTVVVNSYGLHCATVYDSDEFRHLGNERFRTAAMKNVENLKQYQGKVSLFGDVQTYDRDSQGLIPVVAQPAAAAVAVTGTGGVVEKLAVEGFDNEMPPVVVVLPGPFTYLLMTKQAFLEPGFMPTPLARTSDAWLDVLAVQNVGQTEIMNMFGGTATGEHVKQEQVQYFKTKVLELETPEQGRLCIDGEFLTIEGGPQGAVRIEVTANKDVQLFHVFE